MSAGSQKQSCLSISWKNFTKQPGQEAFKEVRGAIREINLRLQVGQNATSQLLAELDTLRGRQAVSAAVQVGQVLMFIGYLLTISVVYMVKHCKAARERLANQEFELIHGEAL